ncbi:DivIVA domain-containing protein [Parenemella sanctibonifatiensis]|uniref:Cell division protein DivIVA n=1 Tax=Parenemella sanctibonifatiensis TaxID=2016505 RepID=A0A255ENN0_9ACTN|nr:DivIVA domain-containing protein [Parenemella sanctibonifatiensis]OYN89579.1 cell division protein DivIVA [Parenemella sanctibonifatiensis]OYN89733.1 cell division protein DivIVA [Parenemella sanctibonifatiensis]
MEWAIVVLAVGVIGITVLVAQGRGGEMPPEPVSDSYEPLIPDPIEPATLDEASFAVVIRGYDMRQVDELLARGAEELRELRRERDDLRAELDAGAGPEVRRLEPQPADGE